MSIVDGTMSISYASTQYDVAASMPLVTQHRHELHSGPLFSTQLCHSGGSSCTCHVPRGQGSRKESTCRARGHAMPEWVSEVAECRYINACSQCSRRFAASTCYYVHCDYVHSLAVAARALRMRRLAEVPSEWLPPPWAGRVAVHLHAGAVRARTHLGRAEDTSRLGTQMTTSVIRYIARHDTPTCVRCGVGAYTVYGRRAGGVAGTRCFASGQVK